jgi:hypothetical protein
MNKETGMEGGVQSGGLRYEAVSPALLDILREIQREKKLEDFLLGDGTGLSLQIGHRQSDNITMLTNKAFNSFSVISFLGRNFEEQYQLIRSDEELLQAVIQGITVTFAGTAGENVEEPVIRDSIRLLHKKDIGAMKLLKICQQKEAADFVDIWYLLNEYPLEELFAAFCKRYQRNDIEELKKALTESGMVNPFGWEKLKMLKKDIFLSEIPRDLADIIKNYEKKSGGKKWSLFGKHG